MPAPSGGDGELFSGQPDWNKLLGTPKPRLTPDEQAFLDGAVEDLCRMCDDWEITHDLNDLPPEVWQFIKDRGFLGMIIPKQYGGLGFSAFAHSQVVQKLATRSATACVSVMVPNSLGPAELLLHYGTDDQKNLYLPRLAKGLEMPVLCADRSEAGSDAGSIPDFGVVCKGLHEGREVVGIRLTWEKRYITLGPVATLLGLAFKLHDPDGLLGTQEDIGITLALIPTRHPGVNIGRRHFPLNASFMNGPELGQGCLHSDGVGDRRARIRRPGLAHADGVPRRGPVHFAAFLQRRCRQARAAHDQRVQPGAQASSGFRSANSRVSRKCWHGSPAIPMRSMPRAS